MRADDPRHGTWAGYCAGCRNDCCRNAAARYQKQRTYDHLQGRPRKVDATGTRRRIEALTALGWDWQQIANHAGRTRQWVTAVHRRPTVYTATADLIAHVYDELSMQVPTGRWVARTRNYATRKGWTHPPLAWEHVDIDAPDARPDLGPPKTPHDAPVDEAAIWRRLHGDRTIHLRPGETKEVVRRALAQGMTTPQIRHQLGIKPERYIHTTNQKEGTAA